MKKILSRHLTTQTGMSPEEIERVLEVPKDSKLGDLAFPCFSLAKAQKKSPMQIANDLLAKPNSLPEGFKEARPVGGYLNFFFDAKFWSEVVLGEIQNRKEAFADQDLGRDVTAAFDYSSPNVAKPMSIGHLRSTVIGQSLVNIFKTLGHKTIGINYLGDWGVQFGKLAWAHINKPLLLEAVRKNESEILKKGFNATLWDQLKSDVNQKDESSFDYLYALYVVFHACSEVDEALNQFGRDYFLKLEKKEDATIEKIWRRFVEISLKEYSRVYNLLNIKHDIISGESQHEAELPGVIEKLKTLGLLKKSEGAQIVDLEAYSMPPCLIQKSDGATLYATRDIAAAFYRHDVLKARKLVYVVGAEQSLVFRQLFKVLELMGCTWSKDCVHVPFGLYRFKDGKMSTRRGNVIFLEDVLDRAVELVREIIRDKNPDLKNSEEVAIQVGTGAVIFNDLMNDRQKNIDFDWDKVLDFNGDTGPYVQYTHARCCSVLEKFGKAVPSVSKVSSSVKEDLELDLISRLGRFNDFVLLAYEQLKPNWVAQYLLELARSYNAFYYQHRILDAPPAERDARIVLTDSTRIALKKGLELLGISAPQAM